MRLVGRELSLIDQLGREVAFGIEDLQSRLPRHQLAKHLIDFAESIDANAVHGSDSAENAAIEIAYFFPSLNVYSR